MIPVPRIVARDLVPGDVVSLDPRNYLYMIVGVVPTLTMVNHEYVFRFTAVSFDIKQFSFITDLFFEPSRVVHFEFPSPGRDLT